MSANFDVAVIGAGVAGVAAACAAQQRGARVCLVRGAPGATALSSGAWNGPLRAEMRTALAQAGVVLEKVEHPLLHERGRSVSCDFAESAHVQAVAQPNAVVCGFAGYAQFHAPTLARVWSEQELRATTIELRGLPAAGWTTLSLAAAIERNVAELAAALPSGGTLLFPAVLGVEQHAAVRQQLQAEGFQVAEVLAAAPSLPGWRLQHALDRMLAAHRVQVFAGRAHVESVAGTQVQRVRAGAESINARAFVLATGKFVAGGITAHAQFQETVFDLPVWLEQLGDVFTAADALPLTDPVRTEPQPLLHAGVHTDGEQRPVDRGGDVVYHNVYVAGSIRADWSATAGLGHCAEDGWNAGIRASA